MAIRRGADELRPTATVAGLLASPPDCVWPALTPGHERPVGPAVPQHVLVRPAGTVGAAQVIKEWTAKDLTHACCQYGVHAESETRRLGPAAGLECLSESWLSTTWECRAIHRLPGTEPCALGGAPAMMGGPTMWASEPEYSPGVRAMGRVSAPRGPGGIWPSDRRTGYEGTCFYSGSATAPPDGLVTLWPEVGGPALSDSTQGRVLPNANVWLTVARDALAARVRRETEELRAISPGRGFDGLAPSMRAIEAARSWVTEFAEMVLLADRSIECPLVSASAFGEVVFEWWTAQGRKLTVYVGDCDVHYVRVWGSAPDAPIDDGDVPAPGGHRLLAAWLACQ